MNATISKTEDIVRGVPGAPGDAPFNVSADPTSDGKVRLTIEHSLDSGYGLDSWLSPAGARELAEHLLNCAAIARFNARQ